MLLDEIEKMSLEAAPKPTKKPGELMSFKDEARMRRDETDKLDQVNKKLQDENARLKQHIDMMGREMRFKDDSKAVALERADQHAASQVRSLEDQLAEAKEEGTKRVSETTQFQQMRKMMQTQSGQIRDLRRRLQKYEPDDCKMDDA
jgi:predicted RNase H-like nuclease (RuvC/YqgF family)